MRCIIEAVAISFPYTRYRRNIRTVLDYPVSVCLNVTSLTIIGLDKLFYAHGYSKQDCQHS